LMENGKYKGKAIAKAGTAVTLVAIRRESVFVEYLGTMNQVAAASTDLAEQMGKVHASP
jgi:hypothetical protein